MQKYVVHSPNAEAVRDILSKNEYTAAGTIIRLAYFAGLMRDEIVGLKWKQVNLDMGRIELADRNIPLCEELYANLSELWRSLSGEQSFVVLSDRDKKPLKPQSVSRLVRTALDEGGQSEVRLLDLRHDFIIRALGEQDWQHVSQISGVDAATLKTHFSEYLPEQKLSTKVDRSDGVNIDEIRLMNIIRQENGSPAALALCLTWQCGMQQRELSELKWSMVDLSVRKINLPEREISLTAESVSVLEAAAQKNSVGNVLLSSNAKKPLEVDRISKICRTALVRAGMHNITLRDLRMDYDLRTGGESRIMAYIKGHGYITRNDMMDMFAISKATAYNRLCYMIERGKLVKIGTKYFLPATVIPPERQRDVIMEYIDHQGFAYRQDIAALLNIQPSQCYPILRRLVSAGDIVCVKQRYYLSEKKKAM